MVIEDDQGRPSGKGIVAFSGKPAAWKALDRRSEGSFLLTTFPWPMTVESVDQLDDEEALVVNLVIKKTKQTNSNFTRSETATQICTADITRRKTLIKMEKQQQRQVQPNIREACEKLNMEMKAGHQDHQVVLMRQGLMRCQ